MKTQNTKTTLYDIYKKHTAKGFNYPTTKMVSDGDICTYLKSVDLASTAVRAVTPKRKN